MSDIIDQQRKQMIQLLKEKSVMKQEVYKNTLVAFELVKECVDEIAGDLSKEMQFDKRINIATSDTTQHSAQLKVAGDVLEFFMHTNVFEFDKSNPLFKTGYVKQNQYNSYCGIINVYNFLSDSFKFNRLADVGYLMCRLFINREMRFFIEAKGVIGAKYSSFSALPLNKEQLLEIMNDLIIHAISFDLFVPPFDTVREVSVNEIKEKVNSINLRIGKRLGYGSKTDYDEDTNMYV